MENIESQEDVQIESAESSPPAQSAEASADQQQQPQKEASESQLPFHEHPRFKELIEQKNSYSEKLQQQEVAMARLQAQLEMLQPKPQAPSKPAIINELKQVHPEFAALIEETYGYKDRLEAASKELEEIKGWRQNQERQSLQTRYNNVLEQQATTYKVPEELRDFVKRQVEAEVRTNPNLRLEDVPAVYKAQFESINKLLSDRERKLRESYVSSKAKDAAAPVSIKGAPASQGAEKFSSDPNEARDQVVKRALATYRASKNI